MLTEVSGVVKYGDLEEGVTVQERLDEVTGLSRKVVIESKAADLRPRISIKDPKTGVTLKLPGVDLDARYLLPVGAHIVAQEGDLIEAGDIIAKMPRDTTKVQDITGGLPRVAELFEARKPKDHAIISEIDGDGDLRQGHQGQAQGAHHADVTGRRSLLHDQAREYLIPKGKHIQVQPGDRVRAGEPLQDGPPNPHDILRVKGEKELAAWLVNEIQQVYRLQGVGINDKHIEVIVRQMLRRVRVKDVGDTNFLVDEQVEKHVFEHENEKVIERGGRPAIAEPLLLGITKAIALDRVVHQRLVLPGDDQGAHRGGDLRQDRRSPRPQGERHHGPSHPGRHRPRRRTRSSTCSSTASRWSCRARPRGRCATTCWITAVNEE